MHLVGLYAAYRESVPPPPSAACLTNPWFPLKWVVFRFWRVSNGTPGNWPRVSPKVVGSMLNTLLAFALFLLAPWCGGVVPSKFGTFSPSSCVLCVQEWATQTPRPQMSPRGRRRSRRPASRVWIGRSKRKVNSSEKWVSREAMSNRWHNHSPKKAASLVETSFVPNPACTLCLLRLKEE